VSWWRVVLPQATDVIELFHVHILLVSEGAASFLLLHALLNYWTTKNAYSAYGFCTNADPGLTMWSVVKLGMHALMPTGYGFALYASVYIMYWKRKSRHKGSVRNHSSVICFMLHRVMQSCALILFLSCPSCPWQSCLTSIHTFVLNLLILTSIVTAIPYA